jgi:hypothetical protein
MSDEKKGIGKELHLHRLHPILFGGSPTDKENIKFVSRQQHAQLVVFWNKKIREINKNNR